MKKQYDNTAEFEPSKRLTNKWVKLRNHLQYLTSLQHLLSAKNELQEI